MTRWKNEAGFDEQFDRASKAHDVPVWVLKATAAKESSFDPRAYRYDGPGKESRGLMQLLEPTARMMGYKGVPGDDATRTGGLYDPGVSIYLAAKYLAWQRRRYQQARWDEVYAAYNAGSLRRGADGRPVNEAHVKGWRDAAAYFYPGPGSPPLRFPARPPVGPAGPSTARPQ